MDKLDLHVSKRLKALLPPLSKEAMAKLEANIVRDGRVTDPILRWHDGKRYVVIDGMHRWEIIQRLHVPFTTLDVPTAGTTYEEVAEWIWDHQDGRRNMTREAIGAWYNQIKRADKGHGDQRSGRSNDLPIPTAAEKVAGKAGVSEATVRRAGARVEAIESLTKGAQAVAEKATDAEVNALAKLDGAGQAQVARAIRTGQAKTVKEAIKTTGAKPPKSYGRCPNCRGTKWDEDEDGVSCAKCHHPHGEPAGDVDDDRVKTQRSKTVKTVEALMRAFDDLNGMLARKEHDAAIKGCKALLKMAKEWK